MPYTIRYNTPMASQSIERATAPLALEAALDLQAAGHSTIQITDPDGSGLTVHQLAELVREDVGGR